MRFEPLEPRLPLAVLDLNPGPYSSIPAVHAQSGDWIYVSADTGAGRRLLRTDGETFIDLGEGLASTVIRDGSLYGIVDLPGPQNTRPVDVINLATGERSNFSTEFGAVGVNVDNRKAVLAWYDNDKGTYHDLDGREYTWPQGHMYPIHAIGNAVYSQHWDGIYRCDVECTYVAPDFGVYGGDGTFLLLNNADFYTPEGVVVGTFGDSYFQDGNSGWWTVRGDVLSHFVGADVTRWTIPGVKYVAYAAPDFAIAAVNDDGAGYDPYLVTTDVLKLSDLNSPNLNGYTINDAILIDNSLLIVGTQLIPMQAQSYPWYITDQRLGFFWHESPEYGRELSTHKILAGDANYDGIFDSGDLVQLFQLGEYEDDLAGNSSWVSGDFNGDGDFDSADIVAAFVTGLYV